MQTSPEWLANFARDGFCGDTIRIEPTPQYAIALLKQHSSLLECSPMKPPAEVTTNQREIEHGEILNAHG